MAGPIIVVQKVPFRYVSNEDGADVRHGPNASFIPIVTKIEGETVHGTVGNREDGSILKSDGTIPRTFVKGKGEISMGDVDIINGNGVATIPVVDISNRGIHGEISVQEGNVILCLTINEAFIGGTVNGMPKGVVIDTAIF